ncbi:MAG: pyridoxal-phosphate dependent enzyme, partial [Haliea sp.]
MLTLKQIEDASELVYQHLGPTPLYSWPLLAEAVGTDVWIKHENHTPIGCFKLRGGLTYIDQLKRAHPGIKGVIAPTRGNHGQSIAYASRVFDIPAFIIVPHNNSAEKNEAMRAHGGTIIEHGNDYQEAREFAIAKAENEGLHMVRSFT